MDDICKMIKARRMKEDTAEDLMSRMDRIEKTKELEDAYEPLISAIRLDCGVDRYTLEKDEHGHPFMKFAVEDATEDVEKARECYDIAESDGYHSIQLDEVNKDGSKKDWT